MLLLKYYHKFMKKAKIVFLGLILSLLFNFLPSAEPVLAGSWNSQIGIPEVGSSFGQESGNVEDIRYQVIKIINLVLGILGILVIVLIIFAGFQWMTAAGNEDQVKKAQATLKNAIIGLVIIMLAWSVSYFIMRRIEFIGQGKPFYLDPK